MAAAEHMDAKVAALFDVHGNLPALEAVLAEAMREAVDVIVSGGDVEGPFGVECRGLLARAGALFVLGNADAGQEWPLTVSVGGALFCHGTPRSNEEIVTRITPDEAVAEALVGIDAELVVCGHTHVQFDRTVGGVRLVNAGSVGMPYEGRRGAYWALVGPKVELRRTEYDVEAAAAAVEALGASDQAGWLREPPDPEEVTAYFEGQRGA
jgi:putative phosphoesterase